MLAGAVPLSSSTARKSRYIRKGVRQRESFLRTCLSLQSIIHCAPRLPALPHIHQRLKAVVFSCDPLHVAGVVGPASAQRGHMINVPARAGAARAARGRAGLFCSEGAHLGAVALGLGLGRTWGRRRDDGDQEAEKWGDQWQWYTPVLLLVWQPWASVPPE